MHSRSKCLSLVSAVALTLAFLPMTASRAEESPAVDLTLSGLISEQQLEQNGHVALTDNFSDDLYNVEYENEDGTRTVYLLSAPAKYRTETGDVRFIDTHIQRNTDDKRDDGYRWKNAAGPADLYLPEDAADGVLLSFGGLELTQTAAVTGGIRSRAARTFEAVADGDRVMTYTAGSAAEQYAYQPTHTGYRGSVTFDRAPTGSAVSLSLSADGLTAAVDPQTGAVSLSGQNGETVTLNGALLADADGAHSAELSAPALDTADAADGCYRLTYTLDPVFFAEEGLTYPVTLSYGVSVPPVVPAAGGVMTYAAAANNVTAQPAIQDTFVYKAMPSYNYNNSTTLDLGEGIAKEKEIYVKFNLSNLASQIRYDQVISACYSVYQYAYYSDDERFDIELHQVKGSWSPSTITWNNKPASYSEVITYDSVADDPEDDLYNTRYHYFMLTAQVQGWLQGLPNNGIMIKRLDSQRSSTTRRRFAPVEWDLTGDLPQFTVTYTPDTASLDNVGVEDNGLYYIKNKSAALAGKPGYLTAPSSTSDYVRMTRFTGAANQKWKVIPLGNGYYRLSPQSMSNMALYTAYRDITEIKLTSVASSAKQRFKFVRNWDGSYHIVSEYGSGESGLASYSTSTTVFNDYVDVNMNFLDDWTLEKVNKGTASIFCFTEEVYDKGRELNTKSDADNPSNGYMHSLQRSGYSPNLQVNKSALNGLLAIPNSDIWIFSGHGGNSALEFATSSQYTYLTATPSRTAGTVRDYSVEDSMLNSKAFYGIRLAILHACSAGQDTVVEGTRYNLVGSMYHKGAHMAIAYTNTTNTAVGTWMQYLFERTEEGMSLAQAIADADEFLLKLYDSSWLYGYLFNRHILGDTAMCLNPQP